MLGKTHKVGGICSGIILSTILLKTTGFSNSSLILSAFVVGGGSVGGLMPDIDHPNSKMGHRFKLLSKGINKLFGHRGATHTLVALMLTSTLLFLSNLSLPILMQPFGYSFTLGYASGYFNHLFLDALTPLGIPFFYPFTHKSLHLGKIKTGQYETPVSMAIIAITVISVFAIMNLVK